ncbi:hypothetical protein ACMX2H_06465 [Arthrobacter sulfonylureivorans]
MLVRLPGRTGLLGLIKEVGVMTVIAAHPEAISSPASDRRSSRD